MIYRRGSLTISESWFRPPLDRPGPVDVEIMRRSPTMMPNAVNKTSLTLVSSLDHDADTLWKNIGKLNRYEARRAETKDSVVCEGGQGAGNETIMPFLEAYRAFAVSKRLGKVNWRMEGRLSQYLANKRLVLTTAKHNDLILVWHAYFAEAGCCRLLHSISHFRSVEDPAIRALIGRSNRYLHWRDMILFKSMEFSRYDWGGWQQNADGDLKRINEFKEGFNGTLSEVYDARQGVSLRGRWACDIWQRLELLHELWQQRRQRRLR